GLQNVLPAEHQIKSCRKREGEDSMLSLFAQRGGDDAAGFGGMMACCGTFGIIFLVVMVVAFAIMWKVFTKAGQPGWAALVPIYNHYLLVMEICKLEILWFILGF